MLKGSFITRGKLSNDSLIANVARKVESSWSFRVHRYGIDHPALVSQDLDPDNYKNLNRLLSP